MEVHKHPHHVTHKKKWGEYLLEFFMLFLAVFLGFIAENIRENIGEKQSSKQYIESFYADMKTDTARLNYLIDFETKKVSALNVLQSCYDSLLKNQTPVSELIVIKNSLSHNPFLMNRRTLQQLANAGGFRLLAKGDADSIMNYQTNGNTLESYQSSIYKDAQDDLRKTFNEVIDFSLYTKLYADVINNPYPDNINETRQPLIHVTDPAMVNKYFNQLFQYLRVTVRHRDLLKSFHQQSEQLLDYFKKKYTLE